MTTLGYDIIIYYFICSNILIYISINTKYKCWWLVRFEDVYKFIRGHRLSLGGSPRSPPFYFPIFIEPMNCFPRSQSQIFLGYWESMYHTIFHYIFHLCWAHELFFNKSITDIFEYLEYSEYFFTFYFPIFVDILNCFPGSQPWAFL